MADRMITIHINAPADETVSETRSYSLPYEEGLSVLNALEIIRREQDPTLWVRSSCRHGVCGACAMVINGVRRLACEVVVEDGMRIDPLAVRLGAAG